MIGRGGGILLVALLVLAGCGTLPEVGEGDCQLRAGAARGEGDAPFSPNLAGGAVTLINPEACDPETLRVFSQYGSTLVCLGDSQWCERAMAARPVEVTTDQLRDLVEGGAADSDD